MNILELIMGREPALDQAEEDLGKPDEAEAHDLPMHVGRCAMRWRMSYRLGKYNGAQLAQIRVLLLIVIVYLVLTSEPAAHFLARLLGS